MNSTNEILVLKDSHNAKINFVGGKAFHLKEMQDNGIKVPDYFVVPSYTIEELLYEIRPEIETICDKLSLENIPNLMVLSERINNMVLELEFSPFLFKEILKYSSQYFGLGTFVSVRSSAIDEDSANSSFAGLHTSYLYVKQKEIKTFLLQCVASAWSPNALMYRLKNRISIKNIKIAIIIQEMVDTFKSGISFSMNINGNLDDIAIVAGYGLGEGIVGDKVETDHYFINVNDSTKTTKISTKVSALVYDKVNGIEVKEVAKDLQNVSCLNEIEIQQVVELTEKCEKLLKNPVDVEFSFDESGKLFALQMRPITTIKYQDLKVLDNTNIIESYPGITLPLSFSLAKHAYEIVFFNSAKAISIPTNIIEPFKRVFQNLISHPYGRIYYRLDNWYKMMSLIASSNKEMGFWENAVGLRIEKENIYVTSFQDRIKSKFLALKLLLNYKNASKKFFISIHKNYPLLRKVPKDNSEAKTIWISYKTITNELFDVWHLTIFNDIVAFKSFDLLQKLISKLNVSKDNEFVNNLVSGFGFNESEKAILKSLEIKELILSNKKIENLFKTSTSNILKEIEYGDFSNLKEIINDYLEVYGDRTLGELKLENNSLRIEPSKFIELLKNILKSNLTVKEYKKNKITLFNETKTILNNKLKWYHPSKLLVNLLIKLTSNGLLNRENMRFERTRVYGAIKDVFIKIGQIMTEEGHLTIAKDIFYLAIEDVEEFCIKKEKIESKREYIENLKEEYKDFEKIELPSRIIYQYDNLPKFDNSIRYETKKNILKGIPVSNGIIEGEAIVITEPSWDLDVKNKILVTKMTDPGWVFLMIQAAGLVSEKGSLLSHTAIVGRELNIPVVVGVQNVTKIVKSGDRIRVNSNTGIIEIIE